MAKILVAGGAGYVGSAACAWLLDRGHDVWVLDDLSRGHRELLLTPNYIHARVGDREKVFPVLLRERFDCVMHFAAYALVAESVEKPELYHENNVLQTEALLEMMLEAGTRNFIFSSTCAIFGVPEADFISEDLPKAPINPYGQSKLDAEAVLERLAWEKGLQAIALRYFNASGAELWLRVGEMHEPETHLIPNILKAAHEGRPVSIFGTDYPTPDGTCIRDYIHVSDLAHAHELAMQRLLDRRSSGLNGVFEAYNLGSETGYSVREVIAAARTVTGFEIRVEEKPRRPGDPPRLVGDSARAREKLGFRAKYGIEDCVRTAWQWEQK